MAPCRERRDHGLIHHRLRPPFPSVDDQAPWGSSHGRGHHHARRAGRRPRDHGPLRRPSQDRLLGGVAGALSARTGLDVTIIRVGLVLSGLVSGIGIAAYVVAWLVMPAEGDSTTIGAKALRDGRGLALAAALIPALVVSLLIASVLEASWLGSLAWPLFVSAAGLVLIWRNGSDQDLAQLRGSAAPLIQIGAGMGRTWMVVAWRLAIGVAMAGGGVATLTIGHRNTLLRPLGGVVLVLGAFVVVFGPWWLSVARALVVERQGRLRAEETADLAARVHDSVLQTLAMIQRHAEEPQRVVQLARAQERELRSWLFEGRMPGSFAEELGTVAVVVRRIQADVENAHGVRIEAVVVGDCSLTAPLEALLAAGREATVNAAKWSGADVVSLFVEVEAGKVSMFVRDRGCGFDPSAVAPDRRGISQSIEGRMKRSGGCAVVRSAPGRGTEVELTSPRRMGEAPVGRGPR